MERKSQPVLKRTFPLWRASQRAWTCWRTTNRQQTIPVNYEPNWHAAEVQSVHMIN